MTFEEFKQQALALLRETREAGSTDVNCPQTEKKKELQRAFTQGLDAGIERDRRIFQLKKLGFFNPIGQWSYFCQTYEEWEQLFDEVEKITGAEVQRIKEEEKKEKEKWKERSKRLEERERERQIPAKISKKVEAKKEKRDGKLKKALEAGARIVERSISKVGWDMAHGKVKVVSGKLDYRSWQILDCAADKIAQKEWFSKLLFPEIAVNKDPDVDTDSCTVIISAKKFKDYIGDQSISNKQLVKIFEDLPEAILKGEVAIPFYYPKYQWVTIDFYKDNICGVALAHESQEFEKYRSKRKLRGKGSGKEEPVFILIFSNPYGQTFFEHARKREACQLLNQKLYELDPNTQELFQVVRWNEKGPVIMNVEEISRAVGWTWPTSNIYARVKRSQKLLDTLYKNNFINKPIKRGKSAEERSWLFFISKGRGALTPEHKLKLIKNGLEIN